MRSLLRWTVIALVVLVLLSVVGGSVVGARFDSLRETAEAVVGADDEAQSASQISYVEFRLAPVGTTTDRLRARVGEPESKATHDVEGLEIECWLYGAAAATGGYQFCFVDDRLRAKFVFSRAGG